MVQYIWDWNGDGSDVQTTGFYDQGVEVEIKHTWNDIIAGNFDVSEGSLEMWVKPEGNLNGQHWLFIVEQSPSINTTEYRLWIDDDVLYFRFIDEYESPSSAWRNISSWPVVTTAPSSAANMAIRRVPLPMSIPL